jgi:hypothetical protein
VGSKECDPPFLGMDPSISGIKKLDGAGEDPRAFNPSTLGNDLGLNSVARRCHAQPDGTPVDSFIVLTVVEHAMQACPKAIVAMPDPVGFLLATTILSILRPSNFIFPHPSSDFMVKWLGWSLFPLGSPL